MKIILSMMGKHEGHYTSHRIQVPWAVQGEHEEPEEYHIDSLERAITPDKVVFIGTQAALDNHKAKIGDRDHIPVPMGETEQELQEIFLDVTKKLEGILDQLRSETLHIHLDLTFGFRTQPICVLSAVRSFVQFRSPRATLEALYYNCETNREKDTPSNLLRVSTLVELDAWARDLDLWIGHGVAGPLLQRLHAFSESVTEEAETDYLRELENTLREFDGALVINHLPHAVKATRQLCEHIEKSPAQMSVGLEILVHGLDSFRQKLMGMGIKEAKSMTDWHVALARWCIEHGWLQYALRYLDEMPITRLCELLGVDPVNRENREKKSYTGRIREILENSAPCPGELKDFMGAWRSVRDLTERLERSFMDRRDRHQTSQEIREELLQTLDEMMVASQSVNIHSFSRVIKPSLILNLTNICTVSCGHCAVDAPYCPFVEADGRFEELITRAEDDPYKHFPMSDWKRHLKAFLKVYPRAEFDLSGGDCLAIRDICNDLIPWLCRSVGRNRVGVTATSNSIQEWLQSVGNHPRKERPGSVHVTFDGNQKYAKDNGKIVPAIRAMGIEVAAECPLTKKNVDEGTIHEILRDASLLGFKRITLMRFFPVGRGCEQKHKMEPTHEEYQRAMRVFRYLAPEYGLQVKYQCGLEATDLNNQACKIGPLSWDVMWNGTVLLCPWAYGKGGKSLDPAMEMGNFFRDDPKDLLSTSCSKRAQMRGLGEDSYRCLIFDYVEGGN